MVEYLILGMEMGRFFALAFSGDTGKKQPPEIRPEGRAGLRKRWRQGLFIARSQQLIARKVSIHKFWVGRL